MMKCFEILVIIVTLCVPPPSIQHFIFPLDICVLADICNHTWIPECGRERDAGDLRLFIDECDLFEYNCDNAKHYEIINYSECFVQGPICPTVAPCPSRPTCPNHRFHRMGQPYMIITQNGRRMAVPSRATVKVTLPYHMLHGKRRYTPNPKIRRLRMMREASRKNLAKPTPATPKSIPTTIKRTESLLLAKITRKTMILKRESIVKNGKVYMKVVKAFFTNSMGKTCTKDSEFLEK